MVFVTGEQDKYDYIFPMPQRQEFFDGEYQLKAKYDTSTLVGFYNGVKDGADDVTIGIDPSYDKDEYELTVNADGVHIKALDECGVFRAVTSLRQIITADVVKHCEVHDKPQFKVRSFMLDISRGRKPRVDEIKRIIDYLAGLKYNEFQLYMEDFCYLYPGFEDLITDHDVLHPSDIVELDKYAKERFIDLVPNQNGFGHMATWLHNTKYSQLEVGYSDGVQTETINITKPEAFELITKIYDGLLPYFSADRVHIGLDEAFGLGRYELGEICKAEGRENVFCDWLNKLSTYIKDKYGKRVIFWNDMIKENSSIYNRLPKDAMPVYWDYADISSQFAESSCDALKRSGLEYYVAPSTNTVLSLTGRSNDAEYNIRFMAETGYKFGATGFMLTQWGNEGHQQFFVNELVPIALGGEYAWNTGIKQHGGWRKTLFVHNACKYVDENVFGGNRVAKLIFDLNNYYFLEPEFIHDGTMCAYALHLPLWETLKPDFYDLAEVGSEYHFENIISYVNDMINRIRLIGFDERLKRELVLGARLVILCARYNLLKLRQSIGEAEADELTKMSLWIEAEFKDLWLYRAFPSGMEITLNKLKSRREEIKSGSNT